MRTAECRSAIDRLLAYTQNADLRPDDIALSMSHVTNCPDCRRRIGHLIQGVRADTADRLVCQECEEQLPEYLQAVVDGRDSAPRWAAVARHLETCPRCSSAYADLADLLGLAERRYGVEPPGYPEPDLSFLRPAPARPPQPAGDPWHLDDLGRLVIAFTEDLVRALRPAQLSFAAVRHKAGAAPAELCRFELSEGVDDMKVTIVAEQERDDPDRCSITVEVDILSRGGWPRLAGTEVTLQVEGRAPEAELTDPFGKAIFEGVPVGDLPRLVFTIRAEAEAG